MIRGFKIVTLPEFFSVFLLYGRLRALTGKSISELKNAHVGETYLLRADMDETDAALHLDALERGGVILFKF